MSMLAILVEPSYEVVASGGCSAQLSTNDTDEHELDIESEDSKVSVGNAAKQSHDVVGVGIDCIFNPIKVSTEADLGPQPDVIHLTSLDVPNETSQISFDVNMIISAPQKMSAIEYIKTLLGKQVCGEHRQRMVLSAYIHYMRDEEHLLQREGGKGLLREHIYFQST
ncbi:hypothetical protein Zm00014a_033115 [Zea mays]|uniref:Uncharacterized protein n=1 Tax=Zea mays TaxID=4577 RepID=A0A3L6D822_MAIZE|nr:hypothetical protein Zm00014a_033115 [Zea mays]